VALLAKTVRQQGIERAVWQEENLDGMGHSTSKTNLFERDVLVNNVTTTKPTRRETSRIDHLNIEGEKV